MFKTKCDKCNGKGKLPYKLAEGVCFQCDGKGFYFLDEQLEQPQEKTFVHFVNGKIKEVVKVTEDLQPENKGKYLAEQFKINDITVYYHKEFNGITKSNSLYSASFEHTRIENTLHILTRLYKCYLKEGKLKLYELAEAGDKVSEVLQKIENAESEMINQLREFKI